jgi:putative phosphoesterase
MATHFGSNRMPLIGVISDTHGLLRPEALAALDGAEHIVHAGDIGSPEILVSLADIAPVTAVRGNNDDEPWAESVPDKFTVCLYDKKIHVLHDVTELDIDTKTAGVDMVISGHSHKSYVREQDGVLFLNPGSAGPRRFSLPVSVALVEITNGEMKVSIRELNVASTKTKRRAR